MRGPAATPTVGNVDALTASVSAELEPIYRYSYTRTRHPHGIRSAVLLFNPVHKGEKLDPTTGKCMNWLAAVGVGVVEFVNLFAYRHADPRALIAMGSSVDVVGPENDHYVRAAIARAAIVVVAWGSTARAVAPTRASTVLSWIPEPLCFGTNADGSPAHPNCRRLNRQSRLTAYRGDG